MIRVVDEDRVSPLTNEKARRCVVTSRGLRYLGRIRLVRRVESLGDPDE